MSEQKPIIEDKAYDRIERIRRAIEDVRVAQFKLISFKMDNAALLNMLDHLDSALIEAKNELAWAIADAGIDTVDDPRGELLISYSRADRGAYNVEKLPPEVRDNPEITRLVADKKAVGEHAKRLLRLIDKTEDPQMKGRYSRELNEIQQAYEPNLSKPSVQIKPIITEGNRS